MEADRQQVRWIPTFIVILLSQIASAYLNRLIPVLAPVLIAEYGADETWIGYLAALNIVGSILFLSIGAPLIRRLGPLWAVQFGLGIGAFALLALIAPVAVTLAVASLLIGFGYGPSTPAGNEVLQQYAPAAHRSLIFSIKQAGVPAGGIAAGLVLPPLTASFGWNGALVFSGIVALAAFVSVQLVRSSGDSVRNSFVAVGPRDLLAMSNITAPLRAIVREHGMFSVCLGGACLAVGQGVWLSFLVVYGVGGLGLTFTQAGLLLAIMQASGVFGRMLLGLLADRLGSARRLLRVIAAASALTSLVLALTSPDWNFVLLCVLVAVGGVTVSSWNGVQLAEVAKRAPQGEVAVVSAGATILIFAGYTVGPVLFSLIMTATGSYDIAFALTGLVPLGALLALRDVSLAVKEGPAADEGAPL